MTNICITYHMNRKIEAAEAYNINIGTENLCYTPRAI